MKQEKKFRILYVISGVLILCAGSVAAFLGLVFQTFSAGPRTPPQPFLFLSQLYLATAVIAIGSGILLIIKRLHLISFVGNIFSLACGALTGPIGAYLAFVAFSGGGDWHVFGYRIGSPLIALSAISLILTVLGYRQATQIKNIEKQRRMHRSLS